MAKQLVTKRERELEKALRLLVNALWNWDMPADVPNTVNRAYINAQSLLAKPLPEPAQE